MKSREIIKKIEAKWEPRYACDWDNVGLLVGDANKDVKHILVALDATEGVIAQAIEMKADMIISHHPMIFSAMKSVTNENFIGRRIINLIKHDISCYAAHTNFDITEMVRLNEESIELECTKVLQVTMEEDVLQGFGRYGKIKKPSSLEDFAQYVKQQFNIEEVRIFGDPKREIKTAAISGGAGNSMVDDAIKVGVDVLVTGDISHRRGLDAIAAGMAIIDAGHYGTEWVFVPFVVETLSHMFPEVKVSMAKETTPFWTA